MRRAERHPGAPFGLRRPRAHPVGRLPGASEPDEDELRGAVGDALPPLRGPEAPRRRRVREARLHVVPGRRRQVRPEKQARAEDAGADEVVPHVSRETGDERRKTRRLSPLLSRLVYRLPFTVFRLPAFGEDPDEELDRARHQGGTEQARVVNGKPPLVLGEAELQEGPQLEVAERAVDLSREAVLRP